MSRKFCCLGRETAVKINWLSGVYYVLCLPLIVILHNYLNNYLSRYPVLRDLEIDPE